MAGAMPLIGLVPERMDLMLGKLVQEGILTRGDIQKSPLASFEDLRRVHSPNYLEAITKPEIVTHILGYEVQSDDVDDILLGQRLAVGGTIRAAEAVLRNEFDFGVNLGGGFHHAEAEKGSGFCIVNDIAVAIARLRAQGYSEKIAIVDLDFHQGNGNLAIFAEDPSVLTLSFHGVIWDHSVAQSDLGVLLPPGTQDETYLRSLDETLVPALRSHAPKLIFYIAGNDVLMGDRLGNFALTRRGVLRRDKRVIRAINALGVPAVITLGGGYSPMAWQCTANLITYLVTGTADPEKVWEPDLRSRFSEITKELDLNATAPPEQPILRSFSESDILGDLGTLSRPRPLLDYYSMHGIEFAFERYGILDKIRSHGFEDFQFEVNTSDPDRQMVRISGRRSPKDARKILLELVVHLTHRSAPEQSGIHRPLKFVTVEWLLIQDPDAEFAAERPKLPGQSHPGLGIAEDIQEFLVQFCHRTHLDGLIGTPSHFHNASVASRWFRFLDPKMEGRLLAFRQALAHHHLAESSALVEAGKLKLRDGTILKWKPTEHVLPVSDRIKHYFDSEAYRNEAQDECENLLDQGLHVEN